LRTFAVAVIVMVTGAGPQLNVMMPPAATAFTTAAEVQLAGVPLPTLRVGWLVSTARAADGTVACPFGLPGLGSSLGGVDVRDGDGFDDADADADGEGAADAPTEGSVATRRSESADEGAEHAPSSTTAAMRGINRDRTGGWYDSRRFSKYRAHLYVIRLKLPPHCVSICR
jgi:hypothetical protein